MTRQETVADASRIAEKKKSIIFLCCFTALCIAFIGVWIDVLTTSNAFDKMMDTMVIGEDYFEEEIVITNKRVESSNNTVSANYFFYYHDGSVNDYHKRMQVPATIYREYKTGDKIMAYTTDHIQYFYEKNGGVPQNEFRNNELKKIIGILLGVGIFMLLFFRLLNKRVLKYTNITCYEAKKK